MLCYGECKQKCIMHVGPILKVISCLDNANVMLCDYARIQVMILKRIGEIIKILFMHEPILLLSTPLVITKLVY